MTDPRGPWGPLAEPMHPDVVITADDPPWRENCFLAFSDRARRCFVVAHLPGGQTEAGMFARVSVLQDDHLTEIYEPVAPWTWTSEHVTFDLSGRVIRDRTWGWRQDIANWTEYYASFFSFDDFDLAVMKFCTTDGDVPAHGELVGGRTGIVAGSRIVRRDGTGTIVEFEVDLADGTTKSLYLRRPEARIFCTLNDPRNHAALTAYDDLVEIRTDDGAVGFGSWSRASSGGRPDERHDATGVHLVRNRVRGPLRHRLVFMAGFVPPPSPEASPREVAEFYSDDTNLGDDRDDAPGDRPGGAGRRRRPAGTGSHCSGVTSDPGVPGSTVTRWSPYPSSSTSPTATAPVPVRSC